MCRSRKKGVTKLSSMDTAADQLARSPRPRSHGALGVVSALAGVASGLATLILMFFGLDQLLFPTSEGAAPFIGWYVTLMVLSAISTVVWSGSQTAPTRVLTMLMVVSIAAGAISLLWAMLLTGIYVLGMRGIDDLAFFLTALWIATAPTLVTLAPALYLKRCRPQHATRRSGTVLVIIAALVAVTMLLLVGVRMLR